LGFDNLREKLLLGGIAPRHVRRYLTELNEHLDDLTREQREAGYDGEDANIRARARLGSDDELAWAMLAQKGFRSMAARAPWAVFLLLPPVVAVLIGMLFIGSLVLIGKYFGYFGVPAASLPPQWFQTLAHSLVVLSNLATMPLAAILFVSVAQRQRLKLVWPLFATLVLLVIFFHNDVLFAAHGKGHLMLGAGPIFTRHGWMMLTENWQWAMAQYALTLLPVLLLYRKYRTTI
jgi:hypothetical protein